MIFHALRPNRRWAIVILAKVNLSFHQIQTLHHSFVKGVRYVVWVPPLFHPIRSTQYSIGGANVVHPTVLMQWGGYHLGVSCRAAVSPIIVTASSAAPFVTSSILNMGYWTTWCTSTEPHEDILLMKTKGRFKPYLSTRKSV